MFLMSHVIQQETLAIWHVGEKTQTFFADIDLIKFAKSIPCLTRPPCYLYSLLMKPSFCFSIPPVINNFIFLRMNTLDQRSIKQLSTHRLASHPFTKPIHRCNSPLNMFQNPSTMILKIQNCKGDRLF